MPIKKLPSDDLSDLKPDLILKAFFRVLVGRYKDKLVSLLARNALRLIDQAVREFQHAFAELRQFVSTPGIDSFQGEHRQDRPGGYRAAASSNLPPLTQTCR